jgi:hypothetical protein
MDPDHIDVWALRAHREGHRFQPTLRGGSPDVGKGGWQRLGVGGGSCAMRAAETVSGEADDYSAKGSANHSIFQSGRAIRLSILS